jgi:hypothetical protein
MNLKNLLFAFSSLVLIWAGVAAVLRATERHTSTPEKVNALMAAAPWLDGPPLSDEARKKYLDDVIANVNRLDFDQRHARREEGRDVGQRFFDSLTREERARFLEETVERHFKSVMKAFNQMSREERQRLVKQSMADMNRDRPDGRNMDRLKQDDEKVFDKVVEKGLGAYYEDASAETKLDLAPLMEQMQQRLRGFGGNGMGGR